MTRPGRPNRVKPSSYIQEQEAFEKSGHRHGGRQSGGTLGGGHWPKPGADWSGSGGGRGRASGGRCGKTDCDSSGGPHGRNPCRGNPSGDRRSAAIGPADIVLFLVQAPGMFEKRGGERIKNPLVFRTQKPPSFQLLKNGIDAPPG